MEMVWQPDVYSMATHLAQHTPNSWFVDIGSGTALKAATIYNDTKLSFVLVDYGRNLRRSMAVFNATERYVSTGHQGVEFLLWNMEAPAGFPGEYVERYMIQGATIVVADVIEHLVNPDMLVDSLVRLFDGCGAEHILVSSFDRPAHERGPSRNIHHVRFPTNFSSSIPLFRPLRFSCNFIMYL
jgi:hypothetical protein